MQARLSCRLCSCLHVERGCVLRDTRAHTHTHSNDTPHPNTPADPIIPPNRGAALQVYFLFIRTDRLIICRKSKNGAGRSGRRRFIPCDCTLTDSPALPARRYTCGIARCEATAPPSSNGGMATSHRRWLWGGASGLSCLSRARISVLYLPRATEPTGSYITLATRSKVEKA